MATRTALLNGNVINRDTDFSKHIEAVSEPGVISGFAVSSSSVAVGKALVKCERTNGDTIYAVVYNNSAQSISGNGDVYIEIPQELIDNGELMNEDGSEIAEIKVGTMPAKNALKLATITSGVVEDKRNMIKKSGELLALINQNIEDIEDLDDRVEALEEAGAINHLEESGLVGELYTIDDILFKQNTPTAGNSTLDQKVGDENASKEIHIQRIGSGMASNKLKLKVKSIGAPTTGLVVEVREGTQVTVTANSEAYWYGNSVICSGSIPYNSITGTYQDIEITMNGDFGGTKGQLLDVVVYQTGSIVNSTNYYCIAYDSTQYGQAFRCIKVNGSTRTTTTNMPYCISDGFTSSLICKAKPDISSGYTEFLSGDGYIYSDGNDTLVGYASTPSDGFVHFEGTVDGYVGYDSVYWTFLFGSSSYQYNSSHYEYYHARVPAGTKFQVGARFIGYHSGGGNCGYRGVKMWFASEFFSGGYGERKGKPETVESLGERAGFIIFGVGTHGEWVEQMKHYTTSQSVTTGGITLGNCQGFLNITDSDGTTYKVPYYT